MRPADRPVIDREQAEALHAEIDRLPRAFRLPVVLCYFEGLTLDEAARRLRCPAGTLRSRLARAREKLRVALARRGIVLSAAALGTRLASRSASAAVPPLLCDSTTRAAIAFAARHAAASGTLSSPTAALAQEVLNTMLIHNVRLVVMAALALAAIASGAGYLAFALAGPREGEPPGEPSVKAARTEPRPPEQRMTIAGRVLDPDGKPVDGAVVDVVAWPRVPFTGAGEESEPSILLGRAESDGDGRYRLEAPRTASTRVRGVCAIAAAPGYGRGWAELNPDADRPEAEIKLWPEQPIRVRLVDVNAAPARGVEVAVLGFGHPTGPGQFDGINMPANPPEGMRTWPDPVKTDDQGRATVPGIGRGLRMILVVRDPRYAQQLLFADPRAGAADKETTHALRPAKIIEGRVLAADTGLPVPNATVSIAAGESVGDSTFTARFRADAQGHYTANPGAGEYFRVDAYPPEGQPYLAPEVLVPWTKGAVKKTLDLRMPRGVVIRGKVTEAGTNRPLAGATIQFIPAGHRRPGDALSGLQAMVASRADGSFQVVVPPGKGHLLVFGPTPGYVAEEIGYNRLYGDQAPFGMFTVMLTNAMNGEIVSTGLYGHQPGGGPRHRAHAIIPYDVKAGDAPRDVAAALRPGVTIRGRVEGPDGQTIAGAAIVTTLHIDALNSFWGFGDRLKVCDGRFELHGLDPAGTTRISILDPDHEWGATVDISGKQAGEDLTIRLQPCGQARARFIGPDGKPIARFRPIFTKLQPIFELVATPGPSGLGRNEKDQAELAADAEMVVNIDRKHYGNFPPTDADGRITLPDLIPGALYRITDFSAYNNPKKRTPIRKEFTVKPGETIDLGDLLIEKPRE